MKKEQIDLIIIKIISNGNEAVNFKIYKDGKIFRRGNGFLPSIKTGCMSFIDSAYFFDALLKDAPDEIFKNSINYSEPTPNGALEYFAAFYNESSSDVGKTNQKAIGVRFLLDNKTRYNHPALQLIDGLAMKAVDITNSWYFDVFMLATFNAKSSFLPEKNIITASQNREEHLQDYKNYILQMSRRRGFSFETFIKNKSFNIDGVPKKAEIINDCESFNIRFIS